MGDNDKYFVIFAILLWKTIRLDSKVSFSDFCVCVKKSMCLQICVWVNIWVVLSSDFLQCSDFNCNDVIGHS